MKKLEVKSKKMEVDIPDLQIESNKVFEVEIYFENEFITRHLLLPGSRFRLTNLTKGDKLVIKALS